MRRAFTLDEPMIVVAIIGTISTIAISAIAISAIAIPALMDKRAVSAPGEPVIEFSDIVGKTFDWNGNKTLIVDYNGDRRYVVVIMPDNGGAVNAIADRKIIMEAYNASITTPKPVQAEKVE